MSNEKRSFGNEARVYGWVIWDEDDDKLVANRSGFAQVYPNKESAKHAKREMKKWWMYETERYQILPIEDFK
jgi:hypothetical protein